MSRDNDDGLIVSMGCVTRVLLNPLEDFVHGCATRSVLHGCDGFNQPRFAEQTIVVTKAFDDPVGKQQQNISGRKVESRMGAVFVVIDDA